MTDTSAQVPIIGAEPANGVWVTVSELARLKGVTRQTAAEKVVRLEKAGRLRTKPGRGKTKLLSLAAYDSAVGEVTDFSKARAAATAKLNRGESAAAPAVSDGTYATEQARKIRYEADLRELELAEKMGELLRKDKVLEAVEKCAEQAIKVLEMAIHRAEEIGEAYAKNGVHAARIVAKKLVHDQRVRMADQFAALVEQEKTEGDDQEKVQDEANVVPT